MSLERKKINLTKILDPILSSGARASVETNHLCKTLQEVSPGSVFFAIKSEKFDGHSEIDQAFSRGASACVVESPAVQPHCLQVSSTRKAWALAHHAQQSEPTKDLFCVGVTGTNGKTSTTYFIEALLNALGKSTGVIGTVDHHLGELKWPTSLTTPDAQELFLRAGQMKAAGAQVLALEISSHALDQERCAGLQLNVGVFTNLTRDHLDYHKDMDSYFQSKQKLFSELLSESKKSLKAAVINADDPFGRKLSKIVNPAIPVVTFGQDPSNQAVFKVSESSLLQQKINLKFQGKVFDFVLPVVGEHNAYNAVAAVLAVQAVGFDLQKVIQNVAQCKGVPGRLQRVVFSESRAPHVFIDYAHTPDALEKVLRTLQQFKEAKQLKVLFGCGGDRDPGKRPLMAAVAEKHADIVFVTSDNPRAEDPEKIISEIVLGFAQREKVFVMADRRAAIKKIIDDSGPGDIVLIAGKGHENYQIIGDSKLDFSDYEQSLSALSRSYSYANSNN